MNRVLVIGGSGLIGQHLCKKLQEKAYNVSILSRTKTIEPKYPIYTYDLQKNHINTEAIDKADIIINLAGAGIADKRWTAKRKQLIADSRIQTTAFIFKKVKEQNKHLKVYISASAIGYYGVQHSENIFSEDDPAGTDFIAKVCKKWEEKADQFNTIGIRTVKIRIGIVLANQGGALSKIIAPVKMGIGSAIGSGKQYMPWIHIDDLCGIFIKAIEDSKMRGAYNAISPEHQTNKNFTKILAEILNKPFFFPNIPAFAIKLIFGEMADIVLKGNRISAKKIEKNYAFRFPMLKNAFRDLLKLREDL